MAARRAASRRHLTMTTRAHGDPIVDPIVVPCPSCGAGITADARFCGGCGTSLTISPRARELEPAVETIPAWRPQGMQWLVLVGAAVSLVLFIVALGVELSGGGDSSSAATVRTEGGLADGFAIVHWRAEQGVIGTVIYGEVRNDNAVPAGVRLQVIALDGSGQVVESFDYWPAGSRNIPPGGTEPLDVVAIRKPASTFELRIIEAKAW